MQAVPPGLPEHRQTEWQKTRKLQLPLLVLETSTYVVLQKYLWGQKALLPNILPTCHGFQLSSVERTNEKAKGRGQPSCAQLHTARPPTRHTDGAPTAPALGGGEQQQPQTSGLHLINSEMTTHEQERSRPLGLAPVSYKPCLKKKVTRRNPHVSCVWIYRALL